jgi:hypothetical protein
VTAEGPTGGQSDTPGGIYDRLFRDAAPPPRRVLARIWATVDRDRVVGELGLPVETLPDDPHLGASVGLLRPPEADPIALLEPNTEGRLALTLARHGEGFVGEYVEAPVGRAQVVAAGVAAGIPLSRPADGPFGPSVLVLGGRTDGPHLVLVLRPAGTIGR